LVPPRIRTSRRITQFDTQIDMQTHSRKPGLGDATIRRVVQQLADDGLAEYSNQAFYLEITFLVPREDDHTIYPFAKKIEDFNRVKRGNTKAMLDYIENKKVCRN